jgi:hypothetical protein
VATKVQTAWRSFSGRFNYQLDLLDIIIVQSVWRRRIAKCSPWFGFGETRKVGRDDPECVAVVRLRDEFLALFGRRVDNAKHCTALECETSVRYPTQQPCIDDPDRGPCSPEND